jgi:haloacetate dehalogenase
LVHRKEACEDQARLEFLRPGGAREYKRCFPQSGETIHAICEDYRATFGIDLEMDTKDFEAGRKIGCPVLLLWGATGGVGRNHKPVRRNLAHYATNITGAKALPCGHYLSEEAPKETTEALRAFLSRRDHAVGAGAARKFFIATRGDAGCCCKPRCAPSAAEFTNCRSPFGSWR